MNIFIIILLCIPSFSLSWRIFHKGRHTGGNVGEPRVSPNVNLPAEKWFVQKLDHFSPTDVRVWKQRYFVNDTFFNHSENKKKVVFLMIGGEGEASPKWMVEGAWIDYAQQFDALCFQLEHRYYGKSHPTSDLSTKNLQYLSSEQALADLAVFITSMTDTMNLDGAKWIAFGGSYPGSLAAWLRMKYPHLVSASVSSSGPLLAKADFYEYFKVVEDSLNTYSSDCVNNVKQGWKQIELLLKHMVGQRTINEKFKLCDPIEEVIRNENDVANLYETLSGNFADVVQYNKDNRNKVGSNITIDTLCDIMTNNSYGTAIDKLAAINNLMLNTYDQKCLDYRYNKMIESSRNESWDGDSAEGGRQWLYQTCTEFGFFQTSKSESSLFGPKFSADFFAQQCIDTFGSKFNMDFINTATDFTNTYYGALDIVVNRVVFVHGSIDPWHALGITSTKELNAPAIYIEGTAHCANMYPKSDKDSPNLKAARVQIVQLLDSWIRLG